MLDAYSEIQVRTVCVACKGYGRVRPPDKREMETCNLCGGGGHTYKWVRVADFLRAEPPERPQVPPPGPDHIIYKGGTGRP